MADVELAELVDVLVLHAELGEGDGHAEGVVELLQAADGLKDGGFGVVGIVVDAPDLGGVAYEARHVVLVDVLHPGGADGGEPGAVGGVVLRAYHDLDSVAGAVLDPADADGVVVAHDAGPHDLRADIVVIRVADGLGPELYHGAEQALAELVGELVVLNGGKITLVGVHHDVDNAAGRLIGRKGVCELRIHDGEAGADAVVVAG